MYRPILRRVLRKGAKTNVQNATVTKVNLQAKPTSNQQQAKTPFSFEQNLYKNTVNSFVKTTSFMNQASQTKSKLFSYFKIDQTGNSNNTQQSYNNRTEQQNTSFEKFKSAMLKGGFGRIGVALGLDLLLWYLFLLLGGMYFNGYKILYNT